MKVQTTYVVHYNEVGMWSKNKLFKKSRVEKRGFFFFHDVNFLLLDTFSVHKVISKKLHSRDSIRE